MTLALVNPLLWWIIDRSAAGLIVSGAVGLTGSAVLLGVNPKMMPAPVSLLHGATGNASADEYSGLAGSSHDAHLWAQQAAAAAATAGQGTLETGVWMVSVLFCSCVCFGNIGRRLAWTKKAGVKGRWGGLR